MANEIRLIDANEAIEALASNFRQASADGCDNPFYQIAEDTISEMSTVYADHFLDTAKMVPLTPEQLRGMNDQAVRVRNLEYEEGGVHTGVVTMGDPNDSDNGVDVGCAFYPIAEYGKTWLAYPYHPAHIDREAWEACEWCEEWIGGDCRPKEQDVGYKLYVGYCKQVAADDFYEDETEELNYCPICGRPLTPEAWAELEKRLRDKNGA